MSFLAGKPEKFLLRHFSGSNSENRRQNSTKQKAYEQVKALANSKQSVQDYILLHSL